MPSAVVDAKTAVVNGKIYLIGGRTSGPYSTVNVTEVYDPANDSWATKASIPYSVVSYASVVVDNKIYVIGGQAEFDSRMNLDTTQIYETETDAWSFRKPAPVIVWQATAGATAGVMAPKRIYVFGGEAGFIEPSAKNLAYGPQTDSWSSGSPLPIPRISPAVAVLNDVLYVAGGITSFEASTPALEQYIPFEYGTIPPIVSIVSPENKNYTSSNVSLAFTLNKPAAWMGYSLDGQENATITGNTTIAGLTNGLHNITVYAKDEFKNTGSSETITFTIVKEPEPFPSAIVAAASGASVAVISVGLLVYFKKRKR